MTTSIPDLSGLGRTTATAAGAGKIEKARQAAVDFESVFLSQVLKTMSDGLSPDGLLGKEPFGSMLMDEYSKLLSRSGGVGIADQVMRELLRDQEVAP